MNLQAHADDLLRLVARTERLESFPRSGWVVCGVQGPESVAAHVYETTLIAMWLADRVEENVDTERVLRIALLHDIGETLLTDLPWPVKKFIGKDAIADGEARAVDEVLADAPQGWREAVSAYEDADTLEARIVKAADRIQMLAKSLQYRAQGRGDVQRFWEGTRNFEDYGIPLVRAVLDRLREHWDNDDWYPADYD
ncbi:HD family hydrolase [Persicimonas caeni]|uniref:5'-deoxynucleotidase n=1 Tax=Persicimonas caeni TaxID=2292766 RepID=A0A4Y6PXY1_PERCE|nr:HD family hydrolase [Persicimonas caeni]QDG53184.1 HD family hydrolase [Persicimonas caeni]QED34406.1 HD family hydrolase [Persicimonas caeni]